MTIARGRTRPFAAGRSQAARRRSALAGEILFWAGALALVVVVLRPFRADLEKVHVALVLLLVVLGASSRGGRTVGVFASVTSFLVFNWFFLRPYGTLALANPLDWVVLVAFLVTSVVAAELLHRQREARRRADADALKDALLASVSHDLRTPLATIKALAHELRGGGDERSLVIEEQADRLDRYVRDLLDLSRLNAGQMPVRVELNAVDDLLGVVVEDTASILGGRDLQVRVEPAGAILAGWFDLSLTVRIVVNIVENATKYTPPGTPIELVAAERDHTLEVTVLDRGPGIAPGEVARVFEPFYRPGATPDVGSAGLGLAVAHRLATSEGASLGYAARPGGGSAFTLVMPAARLEETADAQRDRAKFVNS